MAETLSGASMSNQTSNIMTKQQKKSIYDVVTERVVKGLNEQGLKYFKPFTNEFGDIYAPVNRSTGTAYKGINVFLLNSEMWAQGYMYNEWLTYKQAEALGGSIKKGSEATGIVYWQVSYLFEGKWYSAAQVKKNGIKPEKEGWSMRCFYVFNIAQCEGIESAAPGKTPIKSTCVDDYLAKHSIDLIPARYAAYSPTKDVIKMPHYEEFVSQAAHDHTLCHEAIHSTGHESRLKRFKGDDNTIFGSESYSQEELVAEIGAQMLSSVWDIDFDQESSQAYINGWAKKLQSDPKLVIYAASQATKAVDLILAA